MPTRLLLLQTRTAFTTDWARNAIMQLWKATRIWYSVKLLAFEGAHFLLTMLY
jgi:hypothetical protein